MKNIKNEFIYILKNIENVKIHQKYIFMIDRFFGKNLREIIFDLMFFYNGNTALLFNIEYNKKTLQIIEKYYTIIDQDLKSLFKFCSSKNKDIISFTDKNYDEIIYLTLNIKKQLTNIISYLERYNKFKYNMKEKENIINYLSVLYQKNGIQSLLEKNLKKSKYYKYIKNLNTNNMDFHEFCSMLIDKHDDYIMYISICID